MEEKIAELQAQMDELKKLVGVQPEPEKPRKRMRKPDTRHWEGIPEPKHDLLTKPELQPEPESEPEPEPEKDLMTRMGKMEDDIKEIKKQLKEMSYVQRNMEDDVRRLKQHYPFDFL